jgi:hypothetical protein
MRLTPCLALVSLLGCNLQSRVEPTTGGRSGADPGTDGAGGAGGVGMTAVDAGFTFTPADGGGAPPASLEAGAACAAEIHKAERIPLDLVFAVDQSPSMLFKVGTRTKWDLAREALLAFLKDPRSDGLGVGLQLFPRPSRGVPCATDEDCGFPFACVGMPRTCSGYPYEGYPSCAAGDYDRLVVPIADLPGGQGPLVQAIQQTDPNPNLGLSNMGVAAQGVFLHLRARLQANPARRVALVLVTDGVPTGCFYGWVRAPDVERGIAGEFGQTPSIPTYVIGLFSTDPKEDQGGPEALAKFAVAGGTMAPFIIKPPDDVTRKFADALDQIRLATVPCEYTIPQAKAGALDYMKVNLHVKAAAGEQDLPYVGSAGRCDPARGGWYYDVDPASGARPTRVIACAASCRAFKAEAASEVSLTFGCATAVIK